ncbi:MAG: 4Fe-4S cluster-binding domain-containing protein [Candidatus Omnitrophica bacterium]|nr:4Fe-4S cluster-binding domain-containing protein [Candidatus Omnitrophota bacterium]
MARGSFEFINSFPLDHVWVFLTDRCNLKCGYCFFKNKTNRTTIHETALKALFSFLPQNKRWQFILSGGEPLLEWEKTKGVIVKIQKKYPGNYLSVQSNAVLLDDRKTLFLKARHVNLEVGIDGDEATTIANRQGISAKSYQGISRGVMRLNKMGSSSSTTMTVYPCNVDELFVNLKHLDSLGAKRIEIHPAFLEPWERASASVFLREYRKASAYELRFRKKGLIGREYSLPSKGVWDMVIMPDGKVLPNWTFLSFPKKVQEKFYVMDLSSGIAKTLPAAKKYFDSLKKFLGRSKNGVSYRCLSNFNASLALQCLGNKTFTRSFGVYDRLCQDVEGFDLEILTRGAGCNKSVMNAR